MKTLLFIPICIFQLYSFFSYGQEEQYASLVSKAEALYKAKDYKNSAFTYSDAFKSLGWKAYSNDRYNAACCWAQANYPDSAFFQLYYVANAFNDTAYEWVKADYDLVSLHSDKRWQPLLNLEKANKEKMEANYNKPLMKQLDSMYADDQQYRKQLHEFETKYGWDAKETRDLIKTINEKDSLNVIKARRIIDAYGWLGPDVIGFVGSATLFLVIQHADISTQQNYLPQLRIAVKNGKASPNHLALLEDRVALANGGKQIYGSQVNTNKKTLCTYVLPLTDPEHVDERRAAVGLQPMKEYVSQWDIKWSLEQYKRDAEEYQKELRQPGNK